jgi:hypothetical protein
MKVRREGQLLRVNRHSLGRENDLQKSRNGYGELEAGPRGASSGIIFYGQFILIRDG